MDEGASKPPGLVVLDAMIACAEAACEKYRLAAARGRFAPVTLGGVKPPSRGWRIR